MSGKESSTDLILEAIKDSEARTNKRLDSHGEKIDDFGRALVMLARIDERQIAHDEQSKAQVDRIYSRIEKNSQDIDQIQTELSENRWLFKIGNSLATKIILGAGAASAIGAGGYAAFGG